MNTYRDVILFSRFVGEMIDALFPKLFLSNFP